jgi:hypothetical protein
LKPNPEKEPQMTTVMAFALHAISTRIAGTKTMIPASTKAEPSVFVTTAAKLKELEKLGAAREASDDEIAIAERRETVIDATKEAPAPKSSVGDERPAVAAEGDPQGNKKAAAKAAEAKPAEAPATETPAATDPAAAGAPATEEI